MFNQIREKLLFARFLHLAVMFMTGLILYRFTTISHGWWIYSTVVLILASSSPGLMAQASLNRGIGNIWAAILFIPFIYILQMNYRLIPLFLVLCGVLCNVMPHNKARFSVFYITVVLFITNSFNINTVIIESPIELSIKRFICTMIAISICMASDYVFFRRYKYAGKVYILYQRVIYAALKRQMQTIIRHKLDAHNKVILVSKLRVDMNQNFLNLSTSGDALYLDYDTKEDTKVKIKRFDAIAWKLRKLIFATYHAKFVLNDGYIAMDYKAKFDALMEQAKLNFIDQNI
jgi:uncharacterized membrane protein YccC